ncbi:MAG: complex I NDUFA9 subunit family protein [Rhodocyclaceae bacterium]
MIRTVLLLGGTGFIGKALAEALTTAGLRLIVPTRTLRHADALRLLPGTEIVQVDVLDTGRLSQLMACADAVVNLVGVLHSECDSPYGPEFACAHVELPRVIAAAARLTGVRRIIHVSALGADPHGPSEYLRSKADGEAAIREAGTGIRWTIFRPSVVFGAQDNFLNLFARLLRYTPVFPLGGAHARFQPVHVGDVVAAIRHALLTGEGADSTLELAGPRIYTLADLVRLVARLIGRRVFVIPLPRALAMAQAALMECLPGPLMSRDNVRSMQRDNIASAEPLPFGLTPTAIESIAPRWLNPAPRSFDQYRRQARR